MGKFDKLFHATDQILEDYARAKVPDREGRSYVELTLVFLAVCVGVPPLLLGSALVAGMGLADKCFCFTTVDRHEYKPWGLWGGLEGAPNDAILNPGGTQEREVRKVTGYPLKPRDVVHVLSGGGGGYGPPWERDPVSALDDVIDEYV